MITGTRNKDLARCAWLLSRVQFEALVPHSGSMCLIDTVEFWDEQSIVCTSTSHCITSNPLRDDDELSAIHLIEYGAQAMAIHGGLLRGSASRGKLAALRDVRLHVDRVDDICGEIRIVATAEAMSIDTAIYRFEISDSEGLKLVAARATVINLR